MGIHHHIWDITNQVAACMAITISISRILVQLKQVATAPSPTKVVHTAQTTPLIFLSSGVLPTTTISLDWSANYVTRLVTRLASVDLVLHLVLKLGLKLIT